MTRNAACGVQSPLDSSVRTTCGRSLMLIDVSGRSRGVWDLGLLRGIPAGLAWSFDDRAAWILDSNRYTFGNLIRE